MRGLLTGGLPSSVEVAGKTIPINTDWRVWVDIWRLTESPNIDNQKRAIAILALAFPRKGDYPTPFDLALKHPNYALDKAIDFLARKHTDLPPRPLTPRERKLSRKRLIDWDYDAERIIADFEREYSIDLTNPNTKMHFWRFMALFCGLSDTSQIMEAVKVRAADLNERSLSKEQRRLLKEQKQVFMLPARTEAEALEINKLRGE